MLIRPCAHFKEFTVRVAADAVMLRIPQLGFTKLSGTVVIQGKGLEVGDTDSVAISKPLCISDRNISVRIIHLMWLLLPPFLNI